MAERDARTGRVYDGDSESDSSDDEYRRRGPKSAVAHVAAVKKRSPSGSPAGSQSARSSRSRSRSPVKKRSRSREDDGSGTEDGELSESDTDDPPKIKAEAEESDQMESEKKEGEEGEQRRQKDDDGHKDERGSRNERKRNGKDNWDRTDRDRRDRYRGRSRDRYVDRFDDRDRDRNWYGDRDRGRYMDWDRPRSEERERDRFRGRFDDRRRGRGGQQREREPRGFDRKRDEDKENNRESESRNERKRRHEENGDKDKDPQVEGEEGKKDTEEDGDAASYLAKKRAKVSQDESITTRTGGAYIPPGRLKDMISKITDKSSVQYQRMAWEALKKSINGLINKINVSNIVQIIRELFQENIVRARGVMSRSIIQAQAASPTFTHVYAALVSVINTKFPQIGELILRRLIIQFKKGFKRNQKDACISSVGFMAHLVNQQVCHEIIALEILTLLLENPTDDSVEVSISFLKECGAKLTEVSPRGIHAIFERLRNVLHEGEIDKRIQYMIEVMFATRKEGFKAHPAVIEDLELVEEGDQYTHMMSLEEAVNTEDILNVFKLDPDYEATEEKYDVLKKEILDEGSSDEDDEKGEKGSGSSSGSDSDSDSESDEEKAEKEQLIIDQTETNLVALRRTIYLTFQSSLDFEECAHKLLRMDWKPGQENELCNMILDCCAQQRTYEKFFGLLAQRFCKIDKKYVIPFERIFQEQYEAIHRLETNKLRNVAKFFAHLFHSDAISWQVLMHIHLNEDETTSSSRIFIKILFQELSEYLGLPKLNGRLKDMTLQSFFEGLFPRDNPRNTRFAINFFTSIGLGGLTDELRAHLKTKTKQMVQQQQQQQAESSSDSSSSSSSGGSESDSNSSSSSGSGSESDSSSSSGSSSSSSSSSSSDSQKEGSNKKKKKLTKVQRLDKRDRVNVKRKQNKTTRPRSISQSPKLDRSRSRRQEERIDGRNGEVDHRPPKDRRKRDHVNEPPHEENEYEDRRSSRYEKAQVKSDKRNDKPRDNIRHEDVESENEWEGGNRRRDRGLNDIEQPDERERWSAKKGRNDDRGRYDEYQNDDSKNRRKERKNLMDLDFTIENDRVDRRERDNIQETYSGDSRKKKRDRKIIKTEGSEDEIDRPKTKRKERGNIRDVDSENERWAEKGDKRKTRPPDPESEDERWVKRDRQVDRETDSDDGGKNQKRRKQRKRESDSEEEEVVRVARIAKNIKREVDSNDERRVKKSEKKNVRGLVDSDYGEDDLRESKKSVKRNTKNVYNDDDKWENRVPKKKNRDLHNESAKSRDLHNESAKSRTFKGNDDRDSRDEDSEDERLVRKSDKQVNRGRDSEVERSGKRNDKRNTRDVDSEEEMSVQKNYQRRSRAADSDDETDMRNDRRNYKGVNTENERGRRNYNRRNNKEVDSDEENARTRRDKGNFDRDVNDRRDIRNPRRGRDERSLNRGDDRRRR